MTRAAPPLVAIGLAAAFATPSAAQRTADDFELLAIDVAEPARAHRLADVDGDGKLDLSFVVELASGKRAGRNVVDYGLRTCLHAPAPRFSRCTEIDLPASVRGYDIAELDGKPGAEIVLLTSEGALLAHFRGTGEGFGKATRIALESLVRRTDADAPLALDLLFDLDADGRSELLVPTLGGPEIHAMKGGSLTRVAALESPANVRYRFSGPARELGDSSRRRLVRRVSTQATSLPVLVDDFDGDGRLDIATSDGPRLRAFVQSEDGGFPSKPSFDLVRSVLRPEAEQSGFAGEAISFADLDGRGAADLVVLQWGSSQERTRMDRHVFYARPGPEWPEKPDQIVRSESFFPDFEIEDLNGDGRSDLVIPYFHVAPAQAFKVMTQNALRVQLRLFLMGEDGRYAQGEGKRFAKVDRRVVLDYQLNVIRLIFGSRGPPDSFAPLLTLRGDFDGDGFADLVSDGGDDRLHLRFGNARADYATWPDLAFPFESSLAYELTDLNGDGRSDLVAYYGAGTGEDDDRERAPGELRRNRRPQPRSEPTGPLPESRIRILLSR